MMKCKINNYTVLPDTPEKLKNLRELAFNLYFSWNHEALELFKKIDPETWKFAKDNPVQMLCLVPQQKLEDAAKNKGYKDELAAIYDRFKKYMEATTWYDREYGECNKPKIAYYSAEYGIHECLPIYSGGLGALSGDHIKSASDLGIPLVAVGLLYSQGYFQQNLNAAGMQQESYPMNDWYSKPVQVVKDAEGKAYLGQVEMKGEPVYFHIWRVDVGRVELYLLDTNIQENKKEHRLITKMLYDPDREVRLQQEILLGIGGYRALKMLGFDPHSYHINEGHSAFLLIERIRQLVVEKGLSFEEAKSFVWSTTAFTTHTPVPAGNEAFKRDLLKKYFYDSLQELGLSWDEFIALGTVDAKNEREDFSMTVFALKLSAYANGVSRLHRDVSRKMWLPLYPGIPEDEIPIDDVVNGIHSKTWMSPHLYNLFLRYGGPSMINELADFSIWNIVHKIPDEELWAIKEQNRRILVEYMRKKMKKQLKNKGLHGVEYGDVNSVLDPKALTIGFARRFATYKRGYLLFTDLERLKKIFTHEKYKVQMVIAGKAHPADQAGKDIIKKIYEISNLPEFKGKIIFIENYDLDIASYLVQGVDIWLNNPKRPQEACGTSGMKTAINGGLNLSVLDGWWDEAYTPKVGWAIGERLDYESVATQDLIESDILYGLLEEDVIPLFYKRDAEGVPVDWVAMMKQSIAELGTGFNSHRMLRDYVEKYYAAAEKSYIELSKKGFSSAKELTEWRNKIIEHWDQVKVIKVTTEGESFINKGQFLDVVATVRLGEIQPENVIVECYYGPLDNQDRFRSTEVLKMEKRKVEKDKIVYQVCIPCEQGGRFGYTVRMLPGHPQLAINTLPGLIKWY